MEFHLALTPKPFPGKIAHPEPLFLTGSCFTEQIGAKFTSHKFLTLQNPNGILFNPLSIARSVRSYVENKIYKEEDLFYENGLWGSWDHHTRFSTTSAAATLQKINSSQIDAHRFLKNARWAIITLGSAFVYEIENKRVVANCHKVPTDKFGKRLLSVEEVSETLKAMITQLKDFNSSLRIIFTISPVRHIRDGFIENNRSKATLINAVHEVVKSRENTFYFPAYELVIDDLRDYRFYAEDMVHPNYAATNYVWEKFKDACIDTATLELMKEINTINAAVTHKPFNPDSQAHKDFCRKNIDKIHALQQRHLHIDFEKELEHFRVSPE